MDDQTDMIQLTAVESFPFLAFGQASHTQNLSDASRGGKLANCACKDCQSFNIASQSVLNIWPLGDFHSNAAIFPLNFYGGIR